MGEDVSGDSMAENASKVQPNASSNNTSSIDTSPDNEWQEYHGKLLRMIKKEVKQIMEEAVTRKFIHEDSGCIISLCAAVDACLSHGLKRRALGLFKTNSTTALLQKVAKNCDPADRIYRMVMDIERSYSQKSSSNEGTSRTRTSSTGSRSASTQMPFSRCNRYLWIRLALVERQLYHIVEHLVQNASLYYEREALVADQVCGQLLASLLAGPCALDYSRMKSQDQLWHDLPADELVQRHYLVSGPPTPMTPPIIRRAPLHLPQQRRHVGSMGSSQPSDCSAPSSIDQTACPPFAVTSSGQSSHSSGGSSSTVCNDSPLSTSWTQRTSGPFSPKDYVESLHQNCRSTLLYGKNNVWVQSKDEIDPLPGYLSLHQTQTGLEIRWTPNQLMNSCSTDENNDKSLYWNYALNVKLEEVVYLHCHQEENGGVIVFVGQDGVQRSPIRFPKGSHLLAFLTCLENGLQPDGQLDPPLCLQKGKGKVFPRLKKRSRPTSGVASSDLSHPSPQTGPQAEPDSECVRMDYVFRIVTSLDKPDIISEEMFNPKASTHGKLRLKNRPQLIKSKLISSTSSSSSSSSSTGSRCEECANYAANVTNVANVPNVPTSKTSLIKKRSDGSTASSISTGSTDVVDGSMLNKPVASTNQQPIQNVCESMKKQIVSRAFCGWLAYCRHLRTVRTHLSALVQPTIGFSNHPSITPPPHLSSPTSALSSTSMVGTSSGSVVASASGSTSGSVSGSTSVATNNVPLSSSSSSSSSSFHTSPAMPSECSSNLKPFSLDDWHQCQDDQGRIPKAEQVLQHVYLAGCQPEARVQVWPFLLGHFAFDSTSEQRAEQRKQDAQSYELLMGEWLAVEAIVKQRDKESVAASLAKLSSGSSASRDDRDPTINNEVFSDSDAEVSEITQECTEALQCNHMDSGPQDASHVKQVNNHIVVTNPSVDVGPTKLADVNKFEHVDCDPQDPNAKCSESHLLPNIDEREGQLSAPTSTCVSPASSNGGIYTTELLDLFSLNIHRIDKDVQRCDRNYHFFAETDNLEKLRNVMCTYVWQNLQQGYVQGMCDLVAPFLVIFDDEPLSYFCFCELMKRMSANFPYGGAMDNHFANMRSLIQILDPELFELMHSNGDYTHFYFCYRWFLLDFKREFCYDDVFKVWEMIWSGRNIASSHLVLFIALALVQHYRDIILENNMDFTDVIKFFNEMAERHDAHVILKNARDLVYQIQQLIC